jgi:precorrin-6B methylase 2
MHLSHRTCRSLLVLCLLLISASAFAQAPPQETKAPFQPQVGQRGKDVVWVPTPQALVDKMLDMAKVTSQDFVMDLGSGDGRTVITAAKRGAHAIGIEYNPDMVELSRQNADKEGVSDRAQFMKADLFETDLSRATVITMFLLPSINMQLRPKLLDLKPGTRLVSNTFTMEDWNADEIATVGDGCTTWCTALFWIVPAKVAGAWKLPDGELTLTQDFQMVSGTLRHGSESLPVTEGRLRGATITFTVGSTKHTGTVNGTSMEGTTSSGAKWTATRPAQ